MSSCWWCSKGRGGGRLSHREKERLTELGEVNVMAERGGWKEVDAEKPAQANGRLLSGRYDWLSTENKDLGRGGARTWR